MPPLPCPSAQNEELGLPLTELQSWGQEGALGCTQLQSEEKLFLCLESQSPPAQGAPSQGWGRGAS